MARPDQHGKHSKKVIPEADREAVKTHIQSFQLVSSHHCTASSKKTVFGFPLKSCKNV